MTVRIKNNIPALQAQRRLGETSSRLAAAFERLASGMRINRAADDAAGLAIAVSLGADSRILTQAIRNVNDGVSLLNIAEGALQALNAISVRQRELAEQAANGIFSSTQRSALNREANQLVNEFNRIVQGTTFNSIQLFNPAGGELRIQFGTGLENSLGFTVGGELARTAGDGTFQSAVSIATAGNPFATLAADLNNDGAADILASETLNGNKLTVYMGNGNGTFRAGASYDLPANYAFTLTSGDFNGDGFEDAAVAIGNTGAVGIFINQGNGTFSPTVTYETGGTFRGGSGIGGNPITGDYNGDGDLDLVTANYGSENFSVLFGNGNGTFGAGISSPLDIATVYRVTQSDFNSDGKQDLLFSSNGASSVEVVLGADNGTFGAHLTFAARSPALAVAAADLNNDGADDIAAAWSGLPFISVLYGNGDGTFSNAVSLYAGTAAGAGLVGLRLLDLNGDGNLDMTARARGVETSVLLGNGDGTFQPAVTYWAGQNHKAAFGASLQLDIADFNNDGAFDVLSANLNDMALAVQCGNPRELVTISRLDLSTAQSARDAMSTIDATLERIADELGAIGSLQSRLGVTLNVLKITGENYQAAAARITDADVAAEAAELLRAQILQQAGAAVLAQANTQPRMALMLLG